MASPCSPHSRTAPSTIDNNINITTRITSQAFKKIDAMLPPVNQATLTSNTRFDALYRDLCTNKLNSDGSSVLDQKALKERSSLNTVCHCDRYGP